MVTVADWLLLVLVLAGVSVMLPLLCVVLLLVWTLCRHPGMLVDPKDRGSQLLIAILGVLTLSYIWGRYMGFRF